MNRWAFLSVPTTCGAVVPSRRVSLRGGFEVPWDCFVKDGEEVVVVVGKEAIVGTNAAWNLC